MVNGSAARGSAAGCAGAPCASTPARKPASHARWTALEGSMMRFSASTSSSRNGADFGSRAVLNERTPKANASRREPGLGDHDDAERDERNPDLADGADHEG